MGTSMMKRTVKLIFSVLIPMCLGACVTAQKYPDDWAQEFPESSVKPGDKCDLTGNYADVAEPAPGHKKSVPVSLFRLLFPDTHFSTEDMPDRISLDGPTAGELKVVAWRNGKAVEARQLKSLGCLKNGLVMVNPGTLTWRGDFAVTFGAGTQDNFLYRGSDGWLVLKRNELTVVVPWFNHETTWYRFQPINSH